MSQDKQSKTAQRSKQGGQGMTEYIIIVALIAIAAIGVSQLFGETVQQQIAAMAASLGGDKGAATTANTAAKTAGTLATTSATGQHDLSNYTAESQ